MKRIVVLLVAAALLLSFAGCGLIDKKPEATPAPSVTTTTGTPTPDATQPGGTQPVEVENKVELSIDKTKYDKEERIEVTLDFNKLVKENAVIVIVVSNMPHGSETVAHEDNAHEEYRWLSDFSELPFYMWAPDKDGLFDVRVYANDAGGEELASVTFAVGNAVLPLPQETQKPQQADSLWFTDDVLAEMKLIGFTQPEGFEVLTADELPDNMENDPYFRVLKGASSMDAYFSTIDKAFDLLKASYGDVFTWNYYQEDSSYKWENSISYGGDPFYVWDGDTIRSVSFTFSGSWDGVEGEVLQIRFNPNAEDPRGDYDWQ